MERDRNAGRPLRVYIGCDRCLVQLLLRGAGGHPRVGEVWLLLGVAHVIVAHAAKLGLLAVVDCHCHCDVEGCGGEVEGTGGEGGTRRRM